VISDITHFCAFGHDLGSGNEAMIHSYSELENISSRRVAHGEGLVVRGREWNLTLILQGVPLRITWVVVRKQRT